MGKDRCVLFIVTYQIYVFILLVFLIKWLTYINYDYKTCYVIMQVIDNCKFDFPMEKGE